MNLSTAVYLITFGVLGIYGLLFLCLWVHHIRGARSTKDNLIELYDKDARFWEAQSGKWKALCFQCSDYAVDYQKRFKAMHRRAQKAEGRVSRLERQTDRIRRLEDILRRSRKSVLDDFAMTESLERHRVLEYGTETSLRNRTDELYEVLLDYERILGEPSGISRDSQAPPRDV